MRVESEGNHARHEIGLDRAQEMRSSQLQLSGASGQQVLQRVLQDRPGNRAALQLHAQGLSSLISFDQRE
jgi:hypothetical protein